MIDAALLNILICPVSGAPVVYDRENNQLICHASKLIYPIVDGIPVMLEEKAKPLTIDT